MCCCSSPKSTFTWFGAILINIGFLGLIFWGASTLWFLGFVLSALYTAALFGLTKWVEKLECDDVRHANTPENAKNYLPVKQADHDSPSRSGQNGKTNTTPAKKISLTLNLLYGLAVVSFGVTYFFLLFNLLKESRDIFIATLFCVALPVTMISITLWYTRHIPSMAVTTYKGLILTYITIHGAIDPVFGGDYDSEEAFLAEIEAVVRLYNGLYRFCSVLGLIWLVTLSYYNLSRRTTEFQKDALKWGLVIAGMGFMNGTTSLLPMEKDRLIDWLALNLCVFFPLFLFGMVNSVNCLIGLGCFGLLADAARISVFIGDFVGGGARVPLFFVVFALMGSLTGAIGYQLVTNWQTRLQNVGVGVVHWLDCSILSSVILFNVDEHFCDGGQPSTSLVEVDLFEESYAIYK